MHQEVSQPCSEPRRVVQLAFPHVQHSKPALAQLSDFSLVPESVAVDLVLPPVTVDLRKAGRPTSGVPVPKAAVYEDAPALRLVRDVGVTRKIGRGTPKPNTESVNQPAHRHFRLGVALPDGAHSRSRYWRRRNEAGHDAHSVRNPALGGHMSPLPGRAVHDRDVGECPEIPCFRRSAPCPDGFDAPGWSSISSRRAGRWFRCAVEDP